MMTLLNLLEIANDLSCEVRIRNLPDDRQRISLSKQSNEYLIMQDVIIINRDPDAIKEGEIIKMIYEFTQSEQKTKESL